jgi:hypothetical protein
VSASKISQIFHKKITIQEQCSLAVWQAMFALRWEA